MRSFHAWVQFQKGGGGYVLTHYEIVKATAITAAMGRAVRNAKKKFGRRFRVAQDATFSVKILVGKEEIQGEEADPRVRDGGRAET